MRRRQGIAVLVAGVVVVLAALTVFAIELSDSQATSRQALETQAHQRAQLVSGLIDAVFQEVAQIGPATRARLSTPTISRRTMNAIRGANPYVLVLDGAGRVIAHSAGLRSADRAALPGPSTVASVAHQTWALGDVLPGALVDFASRLSTPYGERILVTGLSQSTLSSFVVSELEKVSGVARQHQLLVDGDGVVIGSTVADRPAGYRFHTAAQLRVLRTASGVVHAGTGAARYFDRVPLGHTRLQLILSVPASEFFASVSGLRHDLPWVIFAAFGVVALIAVVLVARSIKATDRIRTANLRLTRTNAELQTARELLEEVNDVLAVTNDALERSNDELARRAQELARSNTELDQFASIASHDLQEPLRKVRTFTERVNETESANLSQRGADYLRRADAAAERMQSLIEDLLQYSRLSTRARPFTQVDLGTVAADVLDDLSEQVRASGARVTVGPLPTINADPPQMRQLLQNLLSNALKFRRPDVAPEVTVTATVTGGRATLTVSDNGIGFDPQYSERIFRVFERLHGRGDYPGTGIGLALVRKIAERHGGSIAVQTAPGEGASFAVTLQTERGEAAISSMPDGPGAGRPAGRDPFVVA